MIRYTVAAVGLAGCIAGGVALSAQQPAPGAAMADAAKSFLGTLDAQQKAKAAFPFNAPERLDWHFIPKARKGLPLKEMNADQKKAALNLLAAGLSQKGGTKVATIRELEKILQQVEMGRGPVRDPELYYFTLFGEPSADGTWGLSYEGHHCSLNWTFVKGKTIASSPQFFGANPGEVRVEVPGAPPKGTRVLKGEEDLGRSLVKSLSDEQKKEAILSDKAPNDILTANQRQAAIQEDKGIPYSKLTEAQQGMLLSLIREYTSTQPQPLARERVQKIRRAGLDNVKFAWMGGTEVNQPHYYRVQGSTFLIEYDNTQNNANHIHAVWRDFKGDFGMDLLAMHYRTTPHRVAQAK